MGTCTSPLLLVVTMKGFVGGGSMLAAALGATTRRGMAMKGPSGMSQPFGKGGIETQATRALEASHVQTHEEHCTMGWAPAQIYSVVADVGQYQAFLPWCTSSIVHSHNGAENIALYNQPGASSPLTADFMQYLNTVSPCRSEVCATSMDATLSVGFAFLKEKYTSEVELVPCSSIIASLQGESTLLRSLQCQWAFFPTGSPSSSEIDFLVSFEFRNPLHKSMSSLVMNNVVNLMTSSFEGRCKSLYGDPSHARIQLPKRTATHRRATFAEHGQHHRSGLADRLLNVFNLVDGVRK